MKSELIHYVDFKSLSKDFELESGEISPDQVFGIEELLASFIRINDGNEEKLNKIYFD